MVRRAFSLQAGEVKALVPLEQAESEAYVRRVSLEGLGPFLIHIPNGAILGGDKRLRSIQVAKLKRAGMAAGCSDYFLAVPIAPYHGLWLEMKRTERSRISDEQLEFGVRMRERGYAFTWQRGWLSAWEATQRYLWGEDPNEGALIGQGLDVSAPIVQRPP